MPSTRRCTTAIVQTAIPLLFFCVACAPVLTGRTVYAQEGQEQSPNLSFPTPSTTGTFGVKSAGALNEVVAHIQAVSANGWQDLEGQGTMTFPAGDTHQASLYLLRSAYTRLDVVMDSGTRSLRVQNYSGKHLDENGNQGSLPLATASTGVVAFSRVWSDAVSSPRVSLFDQGLYTGTGQNLHRITMEYQCGGSSQSGAAALTTDIATDLYFDPNTHLLLFSVDNVQFMNSAVNFSRVTSYSAYQQFNGTLVPTLLSQTMNGQSVWTLQLNQITINTNPPTSTFSF